MTRKEELQALLAQVVAGQVDHWAVVGGVPRTALDDYWDTGLRAYHGSLDAAKELHDAVLPVVSQYSIVTDPTCCKVSVCWWPDGLGSGREIQAHVYGECGEEARTWFIAILKALIAQEEEA